MRHTLIFTAIVLVAVCGGATNMKASDSDPANETIARRQQLDEYRQRYVAGSGKQPTKENLIDTLRFENARGDKASELGAALMLIALSDDELQVTAKDIMACYKKNSYWLIQITCAKAMLRVDRKSGLDLSRRILKDPDVGLEARLLLAQDLLSIRVSDGFSVLVEGLVSPDAHLRKLAVSLIEKFALYDGSTYGDQGEKIDVRKAVIEAKRTARQVVEDIELVEATLAAQPNNQLKR